MSKHPFLQLDVFSAVPFKGNPLAVIAGAGTNPTYPNLPIQTSTTVYALVANPTMPSGIGPVLGTSGTGPTLANSGTFLQLEQSTDGGHTFTRIKGATSTTLTIHVTKHTKKTLYRAVFTNSAGTANSRDGSCGQARGSVTFVPRVVIANRATPGGWFGASRTVGLDR